MLTALSLKHFIFIDELALDFSAGMTALTGETGAGKSILCDALWLALGAPYDKSVIQMGHNDCTIKAHFNIAHLSDVQQWLKERGYIENTLSDFEPIPCDIERVISHKGRGHLWINQKPAKIKDVQWLKAHLIARHSQHDQQKLLTSEYQRACLDHYGGYTQCLQSVESFYHEYSALKNQRENLISKIDQQKDQLSLLQYQLEELESAQIKPNELEGLTQKQRQLAYAHQVLEKGQEALTLLSEAEPTPMMGLLKTIQQAIQKIAQLDNRFESILLALDRAQQELTGVEADLHYTLGEVHINPSELSQVEQRLSELHNLSRKHGVDVEELPLLKERLQQEHKSYEDNQSALIACEKALATCLENYQNAAFELTKAREHAARNLEDAVTQKIQTLGMPKGRFEVQLKTSSEKEPSPFGNERITFYLSAAQGQPLQSLAKGASGGELSRLSLVIQSLKAETHSVSTLIFDEVDVGVGGSVAERMGILLQTLSHTKQILCITHLAQVAVLAKNHYCIEKQTHADKTITCVFVLKDKTARVKEIARMLGGINITDKTIAYAKSMFKMD